MSLRAFLIRLIWLCMLPLFVLAVALAVEHVYDTLGDGDRDAEDLARRVAVEIDEVLDARAGALEVLAASPLADDAARWRELYAQALGYRRRFGDHVVFADPDGRARFHTAAAFGDALPPAPRPAGRSSVQLAIAGGKTAVGDLFDSPLSKEPLVAVAAPGLRDERVAFVVVGLLPARQLARRLSDFGLPKGWTLALRDSRGEPIARHGAAQPDAGAVAGEGRRIVVETAAAPWTVVLEIPRAARVAPMLRASAVMLVAVLGATLIGVLGGTWASRRLAAAMHSLADPSAADPPVVIDEVGAVRSRLDASAAARERAQTERRQAEQRYRADLEQASIALQVREAQLRGIFDSATDAIVTADASQTIVMANPAAARMFGCTVADLVGSPLERLIPERHRARHRQDVHAFGEAGVTSRHMGTGGELTGLRADGAEFPIDAAISHVHVDGQRLYTVILRDITNRRRAEEELRASKAALEASHADLRRLLAAQDSVQEAERRRIARELHDDLQQTLAAILMEATAAREGLPAAAQATAEALGRIDELATTAIVSTRRIVNDLRPQMLEELGLVAALEALAARFTERTGIACEVDAGSFDSATEERIVPVATCLYRVSQEALNNVVKHARASRVQIRLADAGRDRLRLAIHDDGGGLREADRRKPDSFGLLGMDERVRAVGGTIRVAAEPGGGTTVQVEVELPPEDDASAA